MPRTHSSDGPRGVQWLLRMKSRFIPSRTGVVIHQSQTKKAEVISAPAAAVSARNRAPPPRRADTPRARPNPSPGPRGRGSARAMAESRRTARVRARSAGRRSARARGNDQTNVRYPAAATASKAQRAPRIPHHPDGQHHGDDRESDRLKHAAAEDRLVAEDQDVQQEPGESTIRTPRGTKRRASASRLAAQPAGPGATAADRTRPGTGTSARPT